MPLRHFEIFLKVVNTNSMTKASQELNMTQPAVSMAIKELEDYYHTKLFDRMNRKLYLTQEGLTLKKYAEAILDKYQELSAVLSDHQIITECQIGVNMSIGETMLPTLLKDLKAGFPQINFHVHVEKNQFIEQGVEKNLYDFALVDQLIESPNIEYIPFQKDEMVVVAHKDYPCQIECIEDILNYPLLLREKGSGNRVCCDIVFEVYDLKVEPIVESISDLSLLNLVKQQMGVSILPSKLVEQYGDDLKVISIPDISFIRHFYMIHSTKKYISSSIQDCIAYLSKKY